MKNSKNSILVASVLIGTVLLSGCNVMPTKVERVDMRKSEPAEETMGLSYKDFEFAAAGIVESLLSGPVLTHPGGGRYIVAISDIKNDTMQRIDTDQLVKKIRIAMLKSGKVLINTAVSANGPEDKMTMANRELRGNEEFDQTRVAGKGQIQGYDYSLGGKIIQRNNTTGSGKTQAEYYFQLTLTDTTSGTAFWEDEVVIAKRGSSNTVSW